MSKPSCLPRLLWLSAVLAGTGAAQPLGLFEDGRGDFRAEPALGPGMMGPALTAGSAATAPLQLRSSSRFGERYQLVLVDGSGQALALGWQPGERVEVPGHPGYVVVGVSGAQVTVQQPAGQPCFPSESRGLRCQDANTAVLALATTSPLPAPGRGDAAAAEPSGPDPAPDILGFPDPFAAAAMAAEPDAAALDGQAERRRARAERLQQFEVQRIPADQVPPGMRLLRTPFGDRLVPAGQ
ncbi:MAG: hypothetical protein ACO3PV_12825 [Pseudohongiellaceae bacterium]